MARLLVGSTRNPSGWRTMSPWISLPLNLRSYNWKGSEPVTVLLRGTHLVTTQLALGQRHYRDAPEACQWMPGPAAAFLALASAEKPRPLLPRLIL
eukprot:2257811-Rhodomonas_salina.2